MNPDEGVYTVTLKLTATKNDLLLLDVSLLSHDGTQLEEEEFRTMMINALCDTLHVIKNEPLDSRSIEVPDPLPF